MGIGQRIREERCRKGMSQEEVAKAIDSTKQAVYKYENGIVTNIPTDKIIKLANLFNVSPAYLMGWEDGESEENHGIHTITIRGRDGSVVQKELTDEQYDMFSLMLKQIGADEEKK